MVCRPRLSLCAEREGLALPVLSHFECQPFAPQLTGPFPTACALLRRPRCSTKFRPWFICGRKYEISSLLYGTFREPLTDRPARHAVGAPSFGVFQSRTFRMGSSPVVRRGCISSRTQA